MNPNFPATPRQTFALFCATGKDFRSRGLTMEIASGLLSAISGIRNNKQIALSTVESMLSGQAVAVPAHIVSNETKFQTVYDKAYSAGMKAAQEISVTPMVVGSPSTPLGNDISPEKPIYFVPDGVCGFAWVTVKPGNSSFANWLKKNNLARKDSYYGGVTIWIGEHGQSLQRKEAHAYAMALALKSEGFNAFSDSRID